MTKPPTDGILQDHYNAIGRCASAWSMLEFRVNCLIWELADMEQMAGACLTSQIVSISARLDSLIELLKLRLPDNKAFISRAEKFKTATYGLSEERNRIVHDALIIDQEGTPRAIQAGLIKKMLVFDWKLRPLQEIEDVIVEIKNHSNRFQHLYRDVRAALEASPQKWPVRLLRMIPRLGPLGSDTSTIEFHARRPAPSKE